MEYVFYPTKVVHYVKNELVNDTRFCSWCILIDWPNGTDDSAILHLRKDAIVVATLESTSAQLINYPIGDNRIEYVFEDTICYIANAKLFAIGECKSRVPTYTFCYHSDGKHIDFIAIQTADFFDKEIYQFFI